jgi:hypothetical protein
MFFQMYFTFKVISYGFYASKIYCFEFKFCVKFVVFFPIFLLSHIVPTFQKIIFVLIEMDILIKYD